MNACRRHVIGVNGTLYATDCMEFLSVKCMFCDAQYPLYGVVSTLSRPIAQRFDLAF